MPHGRVRLPLKLGLFDTSGSPSNRDHGSTFERITLVVRRPPICDDCPGGHGCVVSRLGKSDSFPILLPSRIASVACPAISRYREKHRGWICGPAAGLVAGRSLSDTLA